MPWAGHHASKCTLAFLERLFYWQIHGRKYKSIQNLSYLLASQVRVRQAGGSVSIVAHTIETMKECLFGHHIIFASSGKLWFYVGYS